MNRTFLKLTCGSLLLIGAACALSASASAQGSAGSADPDKKALDPLVQEANDLLKKGKLEEATKKYEEATKKDNDLSPTLLWLSRLFYSSNQKNSAQMGREYLERALLVHGDHPECYLQNASIALGEGRLTDAMLNCQLALQYANNNRKFSVKKKNEFLKDANAGLAVVFEKRNDWNSAATFLEAWFEKERTGPLKQRVARAYFMLDKDKDALAALQEAITLPYSIPLNPADKDKKLDPPEVTMALFWAGKSESDPVKKKENDTKAEDLFKSALQKYNKDPKVYQAYANWLVGQNRRSEAKDQVVAAEKIDPKSYDTRALRGLLLRYDRKFGEAENIFDELNRERPEDFFASNNLALCLVEQGGAKEKRAAAIAEVNAKLFENQTEPRATLGWCYFMAGRDAEAEAQLKLGVSSGQVSPDTAYYWAKLKFKQGGEENWDDAYRVLKQAVESDAPFVNKEVAKAFFDKEVTGKASKKIIEKIKEEDKEKALLKAKEKDKDKPSPPPAIKVEDKEKK